MVSETSLPPWAPWTSKVASKTRGGTVQLWTLKPKVTVAAWAGEATPSVTTATPNHPIAER
jgi:hypothetical protein